MATHWSVWLGIAGGILAVALSATRLLLHGFSGGRLRKLEESHPELAARLARQLLGRQEEYRVLLRLLQALVMVLIAVCVAHWDRHAAPGVRRDVWEWSAVLLGGLLFLVVSEGLGRYLSVMASAHLLDAALPLLRGLRLASYPLSYPLLSLHRLAQRWRAARGEAEDEVTAEDEIMSLLDRDAESADGEADLEADERRMIRGILDLDETTVSAIMTPRVDVEGIDEKAGVAAVKALIVACGHSRIPVYRDSIDQVTGIIYAKDLLDEGRIAAAADLGGLLHAPTLVPESKRVGELLKDFRQSHTHLAVVVDEYGGTAGIVTIEDIIEEIVGEIHDEYDGAEQRPAVEVLADGTMVVDARSTIAQVNEALDADLPTNEDYDTVGGYVSAQVGRIPQAGETVTTEHLFAEIVDADPRRILKAKIRVRRARDDDDRQTRSG
jgi:CBS domain containing-hemolysin-like protein